MWARNFEIVTRHLAQIATGRIYHTIMEHYSLHLFWTVFRTSSETFPTVKPHTHKHKDVIYGLTETWFISPILYHPSWLALVHSEVCQAQWETRSYENSAKGRIFGAIPKETNWKNSALLYVNCSTNKVVNLDSHHWKNICMKKCQYIMSTTW